MTSFSMVDTRLQRSYHDGGPFALHSAVRLGSFTPSILKLQSIRMISQQNRSLSSTGVSDGNVTSSTTKVDPNDTTNGSDEKQQDEKKKKDSGSNIFLDNLGKIFLTVIATIILALVRGSYNTSTRATLRNKIEDNSTLDPGEIDDLRIANSEFTPDIFKQVVQEVYTSFPTGMASYDDFVTVVRKTMARLKGEAFTVELGHMIDRIVADILLTKTNTTSSPPPSDLMSTTTTTMTDPTTQPVSLWLTTLTLALSSDVKDRIRILYDILQREQKILEKQSFGSTVSESTPISDDGDDDDKVEPCVTIRQVQEMVDYLQWSCQLPADTQVVATSRKYPVQEWALGNSKDLVPWEGGDQNDIVDLRAFATILRSKSVCAWGECYHKKNFELEEV